MLSLPHMYSQVIELVPAEWKLKWPVVISMFGLALIACAFIVVPTVVINWVGQNSTLTYNNLGRSTLIDCNFTAFHFH